MDLVALFSSMTAVIAPVFLVAALGFCWTRANLPYDSAFITTFAVNVSTPCLVFLPDPYASLWRPARHHGGGIDRLHRPAGTGRLPVPPACPYPLAGLPARAQLPQCRQSGPADMSLRIRAGRIEPWRHVLRRHGDRAIYLRPAIAAGKFSFRQLVRTPVLYSVAVSLLIL